MKKIKKKVAWAVALATLLSCSSVFAEQNTAPPSIDPNISNDAGVQMNRMRDYMERERVKRQIAEDRQAAKNKLENGQQKQDEQGTAVKFTLKKIITDKSEVLSAEEIASITSSYEGKDVTLNDIYTVVEKINALYSEKGYYTCRAFLPPQTVDDGQLKLLLLEGKTGNKTVTGNKYTKTKYITNRLNLKEGEISNSKELNKEMLLFNATNRTQLRIVMKPGAKPGTTDYEIIAYEPQRDTWTVFEDNAGSDTSGMYRTGLFFNTKSLTGNCDNLGIGTVMSKGTKAANASYSRTLGHSGTKLNLLYSTNAVKVVKGAYEDKVKGHANSYSLGLSQPLVINEKVRTELSLDYNRQKSKSDFMLPGVARFNIVNDSVQDVALGFAMTNYGNSHVIYQKHSYVRGYSESNPTSGLRATQNFGFYKGNALYQKAYKDGEMLSARADWQWSNNQMVSSRQYYIGGMYSVRGYKENYLGGDSGFTGSLEYSVPFKEDKNASAFVFFDYGHVYSNGQSDNADNLLSSVGFGLRGVVGKGFNASLTLGVPLHREFQAETVSKTRLHFMLSGQF